MRAPKKISRVNATLKISKFREYMNWYDEKIVKGKQSASAKSISTTLSTPTKKVKFAVPQIATSS